MATAIACSEAASVIQLTNAERAAAGVPALATNSRLVLAAQLHADQMAQLHQMEHNLPGSTYPTPADRLADAQGRPYWVQVFGAPRS